MWYTFISSLTSSFTLALDCSCKLALFLVIGLTLTSDTFLTLIFEAFQINGRFKGGKYPLK